MKEAPHQEFIWLSSKGNHTSLWTVSARWEFIQVVVDEYLSITCIDFFPCPIIMVWSHDICAIFDDWVRVACYHELSCLEDTTLYTLMPIRGMEINFVESGHDNRTFPHIRCKTIKMLVSPNVRFESIFVIILESMYNLVINNLKFCFQETPSLLGSRQRGAT